MKICGLDEVGRGSLAGPLVACAVIMPNLKFEIRNLKDSKKLSHKQRERIHKELLEMKVEYWLEKISVRQINSRGIGWANIEIFKRLIKSIKADEYIVDGSLKIKIRKKLVKCVVRADNKYKCVMAASIIAKVTRDKIMESLHDKYPQFGWNKNMGYGTGEHISAIKKFGVVKYHRDVFVQTSLNHERYTSD